MKKCKLPKDWIIVNSKSYPDRVYYFNVKTKQSTWRQPTLDQTNKISLEYNSKQCKNYGEEEEHLRAMTPEYNLEEEIVSQQQSPCNKRFLQITKKPVEEKETPQMKVFREKILQNKLQKSVAKNKSSNMDQEHGSTSLNSRNPSRLIGNKMSISLSKRSSKLTENNKIICSSLESSLKMPGHDRPITSLEQNKITLTPQMRILYKKIQQKNLGISSLDKKVKTDHKDKQGLEIVNGTLIKTNEKQEEYISNRESIDQDKNIKQDRRNETKKNLARERMQKLRKSLNSNKEKLEEISCSISTTKSSQKFNRSLSSSHCNENRGSASIHRNVEFRLKRLHNKVLKDTTYKKSIALNNEKLQIRENKEPVSNNMTKDKLIEQAKQEVLYEEMDWEPIKDEEITLEVEVVRTQLGRENCTSLTNCISGNTIELTQPLESQEKSPLYIVVDTNVFLSNLEVVEETKSTTFKTFSRPFIVIPWTVIRELDYIKDNKFKSDILRTKARKAISFLNEHFSSKHPRIIGQTQEQAVQNKEHFSLECPDDEILQCCLQIREYRKIVVLLSYDKNLCTKAMIYDIITLGRHDPLEKIDYLNASDKIADPLTNDSAEHFLLNEELRLSDDIFEDTKIVMKEFLSAIIVKQMSDIYGPDWQIYVIIKPPWTIVTVLKCTIKHWIAAISESFQRRSVFILKELLQIFEHLPAGGRKLQDIEHILEKCGNLLQTVNMDKHYDLMSQVFNVIMDFKKKCIKHIVDIEQKRLHNKIGIAESVQEEEQRAEKALQCFKQVYSYARDFCGLAASFVGMAFPFNFNSINPPLTHTIVKRLQPEIIKKVTDLTQNLNKLLVQAEYSIKYQTLLILQQNLNMFLTHIETMIDVEPLDIYYCVKLKETVLRMGLRQLQELSTHYCGLTVYT